MKINDIFVAARKGDFSDLSNMDNKKLSELANITNNGETLLWLSVRCRQWELAYRLAMHGADVGFTIAAGKHRGTSIIAEVTSFSAQTNDPEIDAIERLLETLLRLNTAHGHELTAVEKFDMNKANPTVVSTYNSLITKLSAQFPTDPKINYLAKMPLALLFNVQRFLVGEWEHLSKHELSLIYKQLENRKPNLHI